MLMIVLTKIKMNFSIIVIIILSLNEANCQFSLGNWIHSKDEDRIVKVNRKIDQKCIDLLSKV